MRFNNRNAQGLYYYLFWIYLGMSIFCFLIAVILLVIFYLTGYRESVSLFNLFFLLILFLGAFYFRINAMHYHRILIENENQGKFVDDSVKFFSGKQLLRNRKKAEDSGSKGQKKESSSSGTSLAPYQNSKNKETDTKKKKRGEQF